MNVGERISFCRGLEDFGWVKVGLFGVCVCMRVCESMCLSQCLCTSVCVGGCIVSDCFK